MMTIGYVGQMSMDPGSGVWCSSMKLSVAAAIHMKYLHNWGSMGKRNATNMLVPHGSNHMGNFLGWWAPEGLRVGLMIMA